MNIRQTIRLLSLSFIATVATANSAQSTTYTFDLEGHAVSPFQSPLFGAPIPGKPWTYQYTNLDFKKGAVVMTYDDMNSLNVGDDVVHIKGNVRICGTDGSDPEYCSRAVMMTRFITDPWRNDPRFQQDFRFEHSWDFTLTNPIVDENVSYSTTGFDNFAFGMQPVGVSHLIFPELGSPYTDTYYSIKNGPPGYAFRLHDDGLGDDVFRISAWLMLEGGNRNWPYAARFESYKWDQLVNADFKAYLRNPPPSTEVPEPASLLLLSSGILLGARVRRMLGNR